jgi:hypothetical protein
VIFAVAGKILRQLVGRYAANWKVCRYVEGRHLAGGYLAIWKKCICWIVKLAGKMQLQRWTTCNLMKDMPLVERCTAREVMQVEGKYAAKEEVYVHIL